jgi:hypothetical protein
VEKKGKSGGEEGSKIDYVVDHAAYVDGKNSSKDPLTTDGIN